MTPTLSAVIVNYDSWPDVQRLVAALGRSGAVADGRAEVVVVDNASPTPLDPTSADRLKPARVLLRPVNDGFASGVNAGWRLARGEWLLVMNPDLSPRPDRDWLDLVLARLPVWTKDERLGVVGLGLRNADGTAQPSVGPFPSLARTFYEQFLPRRRRKYWSLDRRNDIGPRQVPWVTGACMALNGRMMAELGGLDEEFFLYYEEVALCRRAWRSGWRVAFDPTVEAVHHHPLQDRPLSDRLLVVTRHGKLSYFLKHRPAWEAHGLAWLVGWEARIRGRLSRDPDRRRAWRAVKRLARRARWPDPARGRVWPKGRDILAWTMGPESS